MDGTIIGTCSRLTARFSVSGDEVGFFELCRDQDVGRRHGVGLFSQGIAFRQLGDEIVETVL